MKKLFLLLVLLFSCNLYAVEPHKSFKQEYAVPPMPGEVSSVYIIIGLICFLILLRIVLVALKRN